ncbi:MAG: DinB family protein [Vicinamibacterales bacterium]
MERIIGGVFGARLMNAHTAAIGEFADAIDAVPADRWFEAPAAGRWSAAALSLHVIDAYSYCLGALDDGPQMRTRLPVWRMWMLRELVMPVLFVLRRFPREAPAPPEVIPDLSAAESLSQAEARARLLETSARALAALAAVARERPDVRITHAYFGAMSPRQTVMLLTGHTRHHAEGLRTRSRVSGL